MATTAFTLEGVTFTPIMDEYTPPSERREGQAARYICWKADDAGSPLIVRFWYTARATRWEILCRYHEVRLAIRDTSED